MFVCKATIYHVYAYPNPPFPILFKDLIFTSGEKCDWYVMIGSNTLVISRDYLYNYPCYHYFGV